MVLNWIHHKYYSRHCLMGSQLMVSAAYWDQISSDFIGPIWYLFLYEKWPVNVIYLMGSYIAWPKVIPLSSTYCYKNCQIWANFKIFHFIKSMPLKNVCLAVASRKSLQCNQTILMHIPILDVFLMWKLKQISLKITKR
jgi:hypothetical protein